MGDRDEKVRVARPATKRRRSQSSSSAEHPPQLDLDKPTKINRHAVGSGYDLARLDYHVRLQDFALELQRAANAVFPGGQISRYTKVDVILLSWEDEDHKLSTSPEIRELADTFANLYGYHVEEWLIPADLGQLDRAEVDAVQAALLVDHDVQWHDGNRLPAGESFGQVGSGVGDDGDGHDGRAYVFGPGGRQGPDDTPSVVRVAATALPTV